MMGRWIVAVVLGLILGSCAGPAVPRSGSAEPVAADRERAPAPRVEEPPPPALPAWPRRASWVVRTEIPGAEEARRVVEEAHGFGLNAVFVQVRGRGDAYYRSAIEPSPPGLRDPDPLAHVLMAARARGLHVHAWVNANFVANAEGVLPPGHLLLRHPEWLLLPLDLAPRLLARAPGDPGVLEEVRAHAQARPQRIEGLFADPAVPACRAHLVRVCADLAERYGVAGIHLDYVRYPEAGFGVSRLGLAEFRRRLEPGLRASDRAEAARDPFSLVRRFPARFAEFRRDSVTALVREVRAAVHQVRPGLEISAAVFPEPGEASTRVFQDWASWLESGLLDVACPMNYARAPAAFEADLERALAVRGRVVMGIGAWLLDPAEIRRRAALAERRGAAGVLHFSHLSLREKGLFAAPPGS
jgi:uncharacterized lipoprotein YddW (UPF0748 family)